MPGTDPAGVTTTARSTSSGTSSMLLYALTPRTLGRLGLMGKTVPPKGLVIRFQRMVRPTLPAVSVAPMTATVRGAKNTLRGELFWSTALREAFDGLMACIFFFFQPGVKSGAVQPL